MNPTLKSPAPDPIQPSAVRRWIGAHRRLLLAALCLALTWHALRKVSWDGVWVLLAGIGPAAIAILLVVNLLMLPLMSARWWLLLRALNAPIGLGTACAYRVAANAVSYFTPGPHFGGEPLSVYLLHRRHGIPMVRAATSVALDRLLELLASMVVLTLGLIYTAVARADPFSIGRKLLLVAGGLAVLSMLVAAIFTGRRPISRFAFLFKILARHPGSWLSCTIGPLVATFSQGEAMAASIFRDHRLQFLAANFLSLAYWFAVFFEFWLMSLLLGLPLSFLQLTIVVVVARLSFFTPLPAGIGVLESALPWVTAAMGLGSALGISLCVIIRLRDLLFGLAGLALTSAGLAEADTVQNEEKYG